ncbi:ankyrin [Strigomonas culicis]|uniref:Ankyrin n=1 Tax=Strigomonas culicis TaxID=28005 RepID=S9UKV0_9TRYP|nr:ankyrin [Strigomonas culicis]|eukprot:EPY29538.1 ankyrin [Strigomonas culicis]
MGRHETVCLLLGAGANAAIPDMDGKTPLYIASEKGFKHVVVVLKADAKDLRHAKAEADAELRQLPQPFMSSAEMVDRANTDKAFSEQLRRGSVPVAAAPRLEPMEVVAIKVPQPKTRTHDPLTGASYGPCRTLEEVGYDAPPEVPKELQNRPPAKLPRIGGTSMVVNTEDGAKKPVSVADLDGEPETEFFVAPRK